MVSGHGKPEGLPYRLEGSTEGSGGVGEGQGFGVIGTRSGGGALVGRFVAAGLGLAAACDESMSASAVAAAAVATASRNSEVAA